VVNPNPARVINVSLGSSGSCNAAYRDAVSQLVAAGVVVVAAAGNEEGLAVGVPANCPGAIAVAGLRHAGSKVGFSSLGPEVAISAPGGNCVNLTGECLYPILTTTNTGPQGPGAPAWSNGSNASFGTSFATPLVAGTAALMLSANPALSPAQVRTLLQGAARAFPTATGDPTVPQCQAPSSLPQIECLCTTSTCGAGMLDAAAAVRAAAASAAPSASIAGAAGSVPAGVTLSLDGSASKVAAGRSITGWRWTLTAGSAIAALVGDGNGPTVQVRTTGVGSFTVQLTVTDSLGAQASASRSITVNAPAAPVVSVLASASVVSAGSELAFDAGGSSAATGLAIAAYQWTIVAGADIATVTAGANEALVRLATRGGGGGTVTVQVTVTDSLGQSASASRSVTITPQGPSASIQAAASTLAVGSSIGLDGSGSTAPSGRQVVGWQWAISSGQGLATLAGSTSGPTATLQGVAAGSVTVTLTVTDSAGAQDSRSTTVSVQAAGGGDAGSSARGGGAASALWLLGLRHRPATAALEDDHRARAWVWGERVRGRWHDPHPAHTRPFSDVRFEPLAARLARALRPAALFRPSGPSISSRPSRPRCRPHRDELRASPTRRRRRPISTTRWPPSTAAAGCWRASAVFYNLTASATDPALQAVQRRMAAPLADHDSAVYMDAALFARIDALHARREALGLAPEQRRLLERVHLDFVRVRAHGCRARRASATPR
jgi:hypothetical protein